MKFEEALAELRKGKKIKYRTWPELNYIEIKTEYGIFESTQLRLPLNMILNDDWEVLEEPGKTFPEVFEAFKEGKKIKRKFWESGHYTVPTNGINICIPISDLLANDWEITE